MPAAAGTRVAPARIAFERLMARYAAALRAGSAVAGGAAALVGLAPPARLPVVGPAVAGLLAWAAAYLAVAFRRGWTWWLVQTVVCVVACRC